MLSFSDYLNEQNSEDKRAFFIHYPANSGKTAFAQKAAKLRADIQYIDLQQAFLQIKDLPEISMCDFDFFRDFLLNFETEKVIILVDNPDFLLNTWSGDEKHKLIDWVRGQLRSPSVTKKTFIFMIQSEDVIANAQFNNSCGHSRVVPLNNFEAI